MRGLLALTLFLCLSCLHMGSEVPSVRWNPRIVERVVSDGIPVVIKNSPASLWTALKKWNLHYLQENSLRSKFMGQSKLSPGVDNQSSVSQYVWSVFRDKNLSQYSKFMDSFICPNVSQFRISLPKLLEAPNNSFKMIKGGMRDFHEKLYEDLKDWREFAAFTRNITVINDIENSDIIHDSDIWITTDGTSSYPHYDIQHNFYAVIAGKKSFVLLSPDVIVDKKYSGRTKLFPYHHPRQRQIQELGPFLSSRRDIINGPGDKSQLFVRTALLSQGDVLYIPPFWLHSGSSMGLSISLGSCFPSVAEEFIERIEELPLPFEMFWSFPKRLFALMRFINVIINEFELSEIGIYNVSQFMGNLFASRYRSIFSNEAIREMDFSTNNILSKTCISDMILNSIRGDSCENNVTSVVSRGFYESEFDIEFTRRAHNVIRPMRQFNISFSVRSIIIYDMVEQWANFLLPEAITPVFIALCRDIASM